jgi:CubicO group peptidase (beta-lactamase class C family)
MCAMSKPQLEALKETLQALMSKHHVPGVSVGLRLEGQEHYLCLGVTSLDNPLPITPDTLFQIGSTSKTFTATAALKLVEEGRLELDAPVQRYLPDFCVADETASARVTVRHLLTHTSGWLGDFDFDSGDGEDALARYVNAMHDLPQIVPVGAIMSYSNSGFVLLGRVIEQVVGKPFDSFVREAILKPLELHDTVYWAHEAITKRFAVGHKQAENSEQTVVIPTYRVARSSQPDGGFIASARDQLRYAHFHLSAKGSKVLSAQSLKLMQTPQVPATDGDQMGLPWFISKKLSMNKKGINNQSITTFRHGGSVPGFQSEFWFAPEENFAYTSLTNAENGFALNRELTAWVLEHFLGIKPDLPQPFVIAPEKLLEYVGWYIFPTGNRDGVELALHNNVFSLRIETPTFGLQLPPVSLTAIASDTFLISDGPLQNSRIELVCEGVKVKYLRAANRLAIREESHAL